MKLFKEFREFISRGNVMDLAVAVILGAAFTAIINALITYLISPIISLVTRGIDYTSMSVILGEGTDAAVLKYGMLIQAIINFILVAFVVFLLVKFLNRLAHRKLPHDVPMTTCPYCFEEIPEAAVRCPACTTILDESKVPPNLR